ncbi:MAG: pilus assembly protein PilM [Ruminococcaceae bacterium]|nr:pilus assembly protein PilM [Oscillospiraceae bacterium]
MLSIDITDRQIKLVRGVHSGNKIKIQDADLRELTLGMVTNGFITDVPMVASELNDIIKSRDIKEKEAVVSITSSNIVYKELTVAKPKSMKNTAIIEAMIQSEMNVSTDYNISFTIAGETEDAEHNKMLKVMAAACPQRLVDGYVRLFQHIGLSLKAVNISNNSITRLITNTPKLSDRMPVLLIQIDKSFLNMNLYEDNRLAFSRYSNIDPADYDDAPDYVTHAVYDNLFRMIQFIRSRKNTRGLQEILFYGEIDSFMEISNAIAQFNISSNMLSMPSNIQASVQFDFSKFANAIGALYQRNKETDHINLLEATSAKASKGSDKFLLGLVGVMAASAAVVGAAVGVVSVISNNYVNKAQKLETDIKALEPALAIVDARTTMLEGFNSYNNTIESVKNLFNYTPKITGQVFDKLREPLAENSGLLDKNNNQQLDIESIVIEGNEVTVVYKGCSNGDPSPVPANLVRYMNEKVLNKYNEPYFENIQYEGFTKLNASDYGVYEMLSSDGKPYDTMFSFSVTMTLPMGNDEDHATLGTEDFAENEDNDTSGVTE